MHIFMKHKPIFKFILKIAVFNSHCKMSHAPQDSTITTVVSFNRV